MPGTWGLEGEQEALAEEQARSEQNGHDGEHQQRDPVPPDETPRAAGRLGHTVLAIV